VNRAEILEQMMRENGGQVTLGQILARGDGVSCKYTQTVSELRKKLAPEWTVICEQSPVRPTENVYRLQQVMDHGQRMFA